VAVVRYAVAWPPLALRWCRKPEQGLLNLVRLLGLAVAASTRVLPDPLLAALAGVAILWPIGPVFALGRRPRRPAGVGRIRRVGRALAHPPTAGAIPSGCRPTRTVSSRRPSRRSSTATRSAAVSVM